MLDPLRLPLLRQAGRSDAPGRRTSASRARPWTCGWFVLVTLLSPSVGSIAAQEPTLDVQTFQPTAGPGTTFQIDRPEVLRHRTFVVGLAGNYGYGLLERANPDGSTDSVVPHRGQAELLLSVGLFERLQFALAMPVLVSRHRADPLGTSDAFETRVGPGDLRLAMKFPLLRGDFAMSGQMTFSLPTARAGAFSGLGHWAARPSLVLAYTVGDLRITGELGWLFRNRHAIGGLEIDDELHALAGASWYFTEKLALIGEASARLGLTGRTHLRQEMPVEVSLGLRVVPSSSLALDFGVGTGVVAGYGAPLARAFVVLRYTNEDEPCAEGPEDFDGFEDGDFCADLDNDADGVADRVDECPNDREDVDGFLDEDGCAETDNDADGFEDAADRCPVDGEDEDGFADEDGCPEPDNDEDAVLDGLDECPLEPEDRDAFQDEDGCPEPGPRPSVVTITDTRILISERIYFEHASDVIRSVSFPLLDQVASVILELPGQRRIRVEGYSDSAGDAGYNLDLSYRRARAVVEYLRQRGVPEARLAYAGYGEANPVAPNDSIEGRALNRRVEFTILEPAESVRPAAPASPTTRPRRSGR